MRYPTASRNGLLLPIALLLAAASVEAQELEPRAYAANPVHIGFGIVATGYSTGNVVFDPTVPIADVTAKLYSVVLGAGRTFPVFGRSASAAIAFPYVWAHVEGNIGEARESVDRDGGADLRVRLAMSLLGGEAMRLGAFVRRTPKPTLGTSLTIVAPTGQYSSRFLVNMGANRWAFKPELGVSYPRGPWTFEAAAGAWLFTTNNAYYQGQTKEQRPLGSFQAHVGYTFPSRVWIAANATYYTGGRATIAGVEQREYQESSRGGLTLSLPVTRAHSIKATWSTGTTTRLGGDFDVFGIAWQTTFFGSPAKPAPTAQTR